MQVTKEHLELVCVNAGIFVCACVCACVLKEKCKYVGKLYLCVHLCLMLDTIVHDDDNGDDDVCCCWCKTEMVMLADESPGAAVHMRDMSCAHRQTLEAKGVSTTS